MISSQDFLKLKTGANLSFCGKRYIVKGLTDLKEPHVVNVETGITLSAAIFACHLLTVIEPEEVKEVVAAPVEPEVAMPPKPVEPVQVVEEDEPEGIVFETPAKKRGRKPGFKR